MMKNIGKFDNVMINDNWLMKIINDHVSSKKMNMVWDMSNLFDSKIVTHSGRFHADEVFSIALVMILRTSFHNKGRDKSGDFLEKFDPSVDLKQILIRRPNGLDPNSEDDREIYKYYVVLDIENGHFDHHFKDQSECPKDENGERLATIGQLWKAIGHIFDVPAKDYSGINVYERIWEFLKPISQQDIYGPQKYKSPISQIISNINGYTEYELDFVDPCAEDLQEAKFLEAVKMAYKILRQQIIREQLFVKSMIETGEKTDLYSFANGIGCCRIRNVEEGEKEPKVDLEALRYMTVQDDPVMILINENPSDRDGTYRMIMVDSEKCKLSSDLLINPAPGQAFIHPDLFMITFKTLDDLRNFVEECFVGVKCNLNGEVISYYIGYDNE